MGSKPFRTKSETAGKPEKVPSGSTPDAQPFVKVEVPYTDYEAENGHPYSVDHFDLGKFWDEGSSAFQTDVEVIESYIGEKIKSGEIANDKNAVKAELKKMEKMTNMKDESRQVVKVSIIVAHIKFLKETDHIKKDFARYANT